MRLPPARLVAFVISMCLGPNAAAHASLIGFTGSITGPVENVLFNGAGFTSTGPVVTGVGNETGTAVTFSAASFDLETPSNGQARVAGVGGDLFDSLQIQAADPLLTFLLFEANVHVSDVPTLEIVATGSETLVFRFTAGPGENRFGIAATDPRDFLSTIMIRSLSGSAIADVRQIRMGGWGAGPAGTAEPMLTNPEPPALVLLGSGLLAAAAVMRRRKASRGRGNA